MATSGVTTSRTTVFAAVILVISLLTAAVALAAAGWTVESIIGLLTAIGGVGGALIAALSKITDVDRKVQDVHDQTTGEIPKE